MYFNYRINKDELSINNTKYGDVRFQLYFCQRFIIDLLMQQKFEDANLINRGWGTRETNRTTPAYFSIPLLTPLIRACWKDLGK